MTKTAGRPKHRFNKRITYLIVILALTVFTTAGVSQWILYRNLIQEHLQHADLQAESWAALIQSIYDFERTYRDENGDQGAFDRTLFQIRKAHSGFQGMGETGEIAIAQKKKTDIHFLVAFQSSTTIIPPPMPLASLYAEPMRRALAGRNGNTLAIDHHGRKVLAAYRYIPGMEIGIVSKVDLKEVQEPFKSSLLLMLAVGILMILIAIREFYRLGTPLTELLQALVDTSADAIITLDQNGHVLEWNKSAERIFGWTKTEALGSDVSGLIIPPEFRSRHKSGLARAIGMGTRNHEGQSMELIALHKNGRRFPVEISLSHYLVGEEIYFTALLRDIGHRRKMEDRAAQFGRLLELSHNEFYVVDLATFKILRANKGARKNLGYTMNELRGMTVADLIPHGSNKDLNAMLRPVIKGEQEILVLEALHQRKNKTTYPVELQISKAAMADREVIVAVALDLTAHQKTEHALKIQGNILAHLSEGIILTSVKTHRIVYTNAQLETLLGYDEGELLEQDISILNAPLGKTSSEETRDKIIEALTNDDRWDGEILNERKDGSPIWTYASVSRFNHPLYGEVWLSVHRDISESKKAAKERDLFRSLMSSTTDAIFVIEAQSGRVAFCNDAASDSLKMKRSELIGSTVFAFERLYMERPEMWIENYAHLKDARKTGEQLTLFVEHVRSDGTAFPAEVRPRLIEQDGREYIVATARNISERKRLEAERVRLTRAIEQSDDTIVITDKTPHIIYVNPAFEKQTGYTREEALGQNPRILKSGKQPPFFYAKLWETLKNGETWRGIFINKHKDGHHFHEEATISPILDEEGAITHYVAIKRDISASMEMQERMAQSEKLAAAGQIAAGVAHEVNNPLTVILGIAQILTEEEDLPERLKPDLDTIVKHARRAGQITQGMLAFSRKRQPHRELYDLRQVLRGGISLVRHEMIKAKIKIKIAYQHKPMWALIDSEQLQEILINLVMNAKHAMLESKKRILQFTLFTKNHRHYIEVRDTGKGIPTEMLHKIFEPFFTTKPVGQGTGLGLSICYGIAVENGGLLKVASTQGVGTTFTIELPVHTPSTTPPPEELSKA